MPCSVEYNDRPAGGAQHPSVYLDGTAVELVYISPIGPVHGDERGLGAGAENTKGASLAEGVGAADDSAWQGGE